MNIQEETQPRKTLLPTGQSNMHVQSTSMSNQFDGGSPHETNRRDINTAAGISRNKTYFVST